MFYDQYTRLKKFEETLRKKFTKKQKEMNKEIFIRDIFVMPFNIDESFGEGKDHTNPYTQHDRLIRLIEHIEFLANITDAYHQKYYCDIATDGSNPIRKDCENKITRLMLNEFSLYSKIPLRLTEFNMLLSHLMIIGANQHENVHLLLSSIPVVTDDLKLLNITIYLQCGPEAKIEVTTKGMPSKVDPAYSNVELFSQQKMRGQETDHVSSIIAGQEQDHSISSRSVFTVKTKGHAQYTQAIDVCLDYANEHSKKLFFQSLSYDIQLDDSFIPEQADQILTSNSLQSWNLSGNITPSITQIDPLFTRAKTHALLKDKVTIAYLDKCKKNKYSDLRIEKNKNYPGFVIHHPPFGSSFTLIPHAERKLGGYIPELQSVVDTRNQKVKEHLISTALRSYSNDDEYQKFMEKAESVYIEFNKLLSSLKSLCKISFFEKLFSTPSYQQKSKILAVLNQSERTMMELKKDSSDFMQHIDVVLEDLKLRLKHLQEPTPNILLKSVEDRVHHFILPRGFRLKDDKF